MPWVAFSGRELLSLGGTQAVDLPIHSSYFQNICILLISRKEYLTKSLTSNINYYQKPSRELSHLLNIWLRESETHEIYQHL